MSFFSQFTASFQHDQLWATNDLRTQRIQSNGIQMNVVLNETAYADRPTGSLVLLHGFTGSARGWGTLLKELALPGMRVIALDMLGHGQSDAPSNPTRYTMEYCQKDILDTLQALGVYPREAILLGYSMGGRIALYCAFSGFFRALILESASPGLSDSDEREQRRLSDNRLAERIEQEGVSAFVDHWEKLPLFASQHELPIEQREALRQQRLDNTSQGLANSLRGVGTGAQPDLHEKLSSLTLPVQLIVGELDNKFCHLARHMAQQLPCARLDIISDAGHTAHLEQPLIFVQLVKEFCTAVLSS